MAVVAIVIMAVVVPIFTDTTKAQTAYNTYPYSFRMTEITGDVTITLTWVDSDTATVTSTAGTTATLSEDPKIYATSFRLGPYIGSSSFSGYWSYPGATQLTGKLGGSVITVTVSGGMATVAGDKISTVSGLPCEWIIIPDDDGELVATNASDSRMASGGTGYWYTSSSWSNQVSARGNPMDASTITYDAYLGSISAHSTGHPEAVTYEGTDGQAKKIGAISTPDISGIPTVSLVAVPFEYTVEDKETIGTLVDLIPLLMIVGLMVAVVAAYVQFKEM